MSAVTPTVAPVRRRGTELALLLFGVGLTVLAYANVGLAHDQQVPSSTVAYGSPKGDQGGRRRVRTSRRPR